jgi:hypothetical protein
MNLQENISRIKEVMGILSETDQNQKLNACKSTYNNELLEKAKDWWLRTLISPNTFSKILYKKYGFKSIEQVPKEKEDLFLLDYKKNILGAMDFIKKIKLNHTFSENGYAAWVQFDRPEMIHINCNFLLNKEDALSILVHELQHNIDKSLNIGNKNIFDITSKFDPNKPLKRVSIDYLENEFDKMVDMFGGKKNNDTYLPDSYFSKENLRKSPEYQNQYYNCRETEIASRLAELRHKLKIPLSQQISVEFLRRNQSAYDLMYLTILCWAARTDNLSLDDFLTNVDVLVKKQNKPNSTQV